VHQKNEIVTKRKSVIEKVRCETNIYENGGSMFGKIWRIYDNTIEAKIVSDKPHCDFEQAQS
jgi:hypothetical protein